MTVDDLGADEPLGEVPPVSAELDLVAEGLAAGGPMVGIAIRLPVATLDAARLIAHDEGVKVTAMLREWIDQRVAERVDDARVVTVADLRRLIAHRAQDLQPARDTGGDELHAVAAAPVRTTTTASAKPQLPEVAKAKPEVAKPEPEVAKPKPEVTKPEVAAETVKPKAADSGKTKSKASGAAKGKAKSKSAGHGSGKGGPKAG